MISSARRSRTSLKSWLFAGAAAWAFCGGHALAQDQASAERFYFESDELELPSQTVRRLKGNVVGRYLGNTLKADEMEHDEANGVVSAHNAVIVDAQGSALFARSIILDDQLRAGLAVAVSARRTIAVTGYVAPTVEAKFVAASAIRYSDTLSELNQATYTPAAIHRPDGSPKAPTWSISASRIVQDKERSLLYFRNAVVRVKDVPVFWTPIFWAADPDVERASGLLAPRFQQTQRRGLSYEQPYLWVISPYQDLVVSPQFNAEVQPLFNLRWRKRFYSGLIDARLGYTKEQDFNTRGVKFGQERDKAYILGSGVFDPDGAWRWGFTVERVKDKLLFDQYSIPSVSSINGLFLSDDRRLLSQVYTVRQGRRSYLSISALGFQSLRPLALAPNIFGIRPFEDDQTLPVVAPLVEARYEPERAILGGRLRLQASAVALTRNEAPGAPGTPGVDSRRLTGEADWRSFFTWRAGLRAEPFFSARADSYHVSDMGPGSATTTRGLGVIGVDFSLPFIRRTGQATIILEPLAQIALSLDARAYPSIPNEDSIAFDFNETNLFEANKPPGFDLYESGQRLNLGLRAALDWGDGRSARLLVGRSFRAEIDPVFAPRSGLRSRGSDWIVAAEATPVAGLSFYAKARLEPTALDVRRAEFGADMELSRGHGQLRYLREDQDFSGVAREDIEAAGEVFITQNWGVTFNAVLDIEQDAWRRQTFGVVYLDESTRIEAVYQRDENPVLGGRSSNSLVIRLTLATLGDAGYR